MCVNTCIHFQLPIYGYLPILHVWILHSNFCVYRDLPTRPVDYGESCCSPHFVVLLSLSPKSTEVKKISETEDKADCCTFTSGRRQNMTFQYKNTGYKNTWSRAFQPKISVGLHEDFLNTSYAFVFHTWLYCFGT